jgi:hypothetical protein
MPQDNATQTGADSLQPAHAGRNAALAQIARAVNESYQEDLSPFDETSGQILPKQQATQATQQPAQTTAEAEQDGEQQGEQDEQQEQQQAAPATTTPEEDVETIVVQGQQVQVKKSQLLDAGRRTLQKEATADKRLQEATELLRQAQAYAQGTRQSAQPSQDAGQFSQSLPGQDETNGSGAQARQATPDPRALVREELWMHDATKAAQKFQDEFKDIAADPLLMRLASQLEDERLAQAAEQGLPPGDPWEAYRKHGETIRERFLKPQATTVTPAVSADRLERKRSTTTVVGSGARMQASQPQKALTTSEIIEQQRLARQRGRQIQPAR